MNVISEPLLVYTGELGRLGTGKKSEKKEVPVFSKVGRGKC